MDQMFSATTSWAEKSQEMFQTARFGETPLTVELLSASLGSIFIYTLFQIKLNFSRIFASLSSIGDLIQLSLELHLTVVFTL